MARQKITKEDVYRFKISVSDANDLKLDPEELKGITEIIPDKKYRIVISNGFKKDGSRDRISETFNGTLLETIARKKEIKLKLEEKNINVNSKSTFEVFAKVYCNYLEEKVENGQLELSTYEGYYGILYRYILPYFKDMIITEINERDVESWIAKLSKTKTQNSKRSGEYLHPTTIAHAFKLLNNMFNFAKLDRILRENPCEFVKKKPTEKPEEREYFTLEEMDYVKELLATESIRLKTAMFLAMDTGCRREEICGLKWEDIDFENNTIDINKAVISTGTKTPISKDRVREKGVKSKHSKRKIGVPSVSINLLRQYRNFKKDSGLRVRDSDYVFTNWDSNKVLDPNRLTADWGAFRKKYNIKKDVPVHGLRHSNATFLLSTGMPNKDVAKRLGHTPEVLDRVYTHSNLDDDKKLVKELEEKFYNNNIRKFNTRSIISTIAGYVYNEYEKENFELMDYITKERITKDNLDLYLDSCKEYLLSIYPVLDIFYYNDIIKDQKVFNEKMENFESFMGNELKVAQHPDGINIDKLKI